MTTAQTVLLDETERQQVFRACLDALSQPGTARPLQVTRHAAARLPMLALTDLMTPIAALGDDPDTRTAVEEIAALTRAPISTVGAARWVLAGPDLTADRLAELPQGSDEEPQLGAMLVVPLPAGTPHRYRLSGPGIKDHRELELTLSPELVRARADLLTDYPRGFDLLCVTADARVIGLPRTTEITNITEEQR
ncbi:phosphonate C-P lyase system protein PhnH [Naumannella sp. ID2617S]|uniref:phosphonate C-P lyase system protein PhnH n=1 Tax=Enemella dayhoffiae TaxID=2016507 RepID=UPI00148781DF|nr:phosphonate C-P lyase system protein PhnH [Enemella dayhoffiae]NNG19819.1 phosphonate C-P lyase system protein PhnH [Naumannella sp. ID2617S]